MADDCLLGYGKMTLSAQAPLLVTGITVLTADPDNVSTKGEVSKFPPCDADITTGLSSKTYGRIELSASVNITSAVTTALVSAQIVTDGGAVLSTTNVNTGTGVYDLKARTYTQPGTKYFVELIILNSDDTTSVTVNGGSFSIKINGSD